MYRRDPIVDSSPMAPQAPRPSNGDFESDDELFDDFVTQPTLPVNPTVPTRSAYFAPAAAAYVTQPTQPLPTTPKSNRVDRESQVQVIRSSPPASDFYSPSRVSQRPFANAMAPPGTYLRRPPPATRPLQIDLTSDDPPVEPDPEEEDILGSNIKPSRIEETPQKRPFSLAGYQYNPAELARKRPANDNHSSALHPSKRPQSIPRQSGPARAMPVTLAIESLDQIPDYSMRKKVERMLTIVPHKSVHEVYEAFVAKRGNWEDASELLTREPSDDELLSSPKLVPVKTAKRELNAPTKSIHEKFSTIRQAQPTRTDNDNDSQPKKKGRLVRGRRNPSPAASMSPQVPLRPKPKATPVESDDEAIAISSDSEAAMSEEEQADDGSLLKFFNTCSVDAMVDLSNQKEDIVRAVLAHRPFTSMAAVEKADIDIELAAGKKKPRKPKATAGEKLVESASNMWRGYTAVDQLVERCEARGKTIAAAMAKWGVDVFGGATDGEVAITTLDDGSDTSSIRDSGIGTPRDGSDTEADPVQRLSQGKASQAKITLLKKPSIMSEHFQLKDYQLVGLNWLNLLWQNEISGILADDMGLGKTCQVISFLTHLRQLKVPGPHLIVVPGSTLENWLREFQRFSPSIAVEPYYGSQNSRQEQQDKIERNKSAIDVIVTTYDLAYKKFDNAFLRKCRPQACVYDEGHVLRNSTTQRYQSLMRIPAKFRLLLTGTPLQNNLRELASILAFIMPDIFKDVEEDLAIVFKHKAKTTDSDTHSQLLSTQRIQRARSMMTPFVLRRKKAQVLKHLPEKTCRVEYCDLTDSQTKLYEEQLERQRQVLKDRAAGIITKDHANVMMKLRQAAIHPLLFRSHYNENQIRKMSKACLKEETFRESNPNIIFEELQLYQDYQCHSLALKYPDALGRFMLAKDEWMDSGKVKKLAELLAKFKENGDRTLIFSQFTSVMDILEWVLDTLDMGYFRLDGQTPIAQRQDMLDQFYEDETIPVFMLSTKSGGAGINLACANKVIIFDSSFNPQDDIQAENRAHRVGQTRDVEVIRLVSKGTVEEQIHALGVSKLELDKMVAGEDGATETKGVKGAADVKLSAAEELGLEAVEDMLLQQLLRKEGGSDETKKKDLKDQFLHGLKKAGVNVAA
ncbi:SNF2 family N-terminal domain-domain-containing protein [Clohesyomyces aquaticus]|uniref:DNA helicase n=1 Tax=Clohesyomyces aquaticus TaxID=1231657 RepID=A0A1Y1ZXN4_9PLEO|nr:SNF2 family N-terminal domain-domain-containing protein [Clohesyomyces aquaticus]